MAQTLAKKSCEMGHKILQLSGLAHFEEITV